MKTQPKTATKSKPVSFSSKKSPPVEIGKPFPSMAEAAGGEGGEENIAKVSAILYKDFRSFADQILKSRCGPGQLTKLLLRDRLIVADDLVLHRLETALADLSTPIGAVLTIAKMIWDRRYGAVPQQVMEEEYPRTSFDAASTAEVGGGEIISAKGDEEQYTAALRRVRAAKKAPSPTDPESDSNLH